ncbi:MAG: hypothetical protein R3C19_24775 [Planctomycetaceae bacterium]
MAIVFVHGVNNRAGAAYAAEVASRKRFLQRHFSGAGVDGKLLGNPVGVTSPYWGDLGVTFNWNMASLPKSKLQALGGAGGTDEAALIALVRDALPGEIGPEPLTALAKHDFRAAVDVISELAINSAQQGSEAQVAEFIVAIAEYADANPQPDWIAGIQNDQSLLTTLEDKVKQQSGVQSLGVGAALGKLKMGAMKLKQAAQNLAGSALDKAGDFASTKLLARSRASLNETLGRFFGDVFVYFNSRGDRSSPGQIPQRIIQAFDDAKAATPSEPLVIVAHSLGGVISYDILSHFRQDLHVDLFITVGSQVAHFEEMKLYHSSDRSVGPPNKVAKPQNVARWINVYDEVDIFAYGLDGVFDGFDLDLPYDTRTYVIKAHGAYWEQADFYRRLRARVDSL